MELNQSNSYHYRYSDLRLSKRKLIPIILQEGQHLQGRYIKLAYLIAQENDVVAWDEPLVCISVGKKIGLAVTRNCIKRKIRASFFKSIKLHNVFMLVMAKNNIVLSAGSKKSVSSELILNDLQTILKKI